MSEPIVRIVFKYCKLKEKEVSLIEEYSGEASRPSDSQWKTQSCRYMEDDCLEQECEYFGV